jgi:maltose alpha-D-glucosyltransferase / alpha-amylase
MSGPLGNVGGRYATHRIRPRRGAFSFGHNPVHVTIDAPQFAGSRLNDLFGGGELPAIADAGRFSLTFGTQSSYWLGMAPQ